MDNSLTKHDDDFTRQLAEFEKIQDTCKKLLATKHYSNLGEAGIHAVLAKAKALGIHPFEALNGGFFCINGKVGMSTEMMAALIRRRGHSITKDPKSNHELVILHGVRADNGDKWTCTFSKQDAENAGLWNSATWKKYPAVMLYNRCMSMLFRQLFPDLSLGAGYVEDELKEIARVEDYKPSIEITGEHVKPLYIDNQIEVSRETIGAEKALDIKNILIECSEDYQENRKKFFKDELKIPSMDKIPLDMYEGIRNAALKKRDEFYALQAYEYQKKQELEAKVEEN